MECQVGLESIAAISSAIAAIASVCVAKGVFSFQRNALLRKGEADRILDLIAQLHYLKLLANRPVLDASDDDVSSLKDRLLQVRICLETIESMASESASSGINRIRDFLNAIHDGRVFATDEKTPNSEAIKNLDAALSELRKLYRMETK